MDRLVGVSMGSWVGGWLGASVGMWLIAFVTVGGDPGVVFFIECFRDGDPSDPVLCFGTFFRPLLYRHRSGEIPRTIFFCPLFRPRSGIVRRTTYGW